jgi:hypothetical protein
MRAKRIRDVRLMPERRWACVWPLRTSSTSIFRYGYSNIGFTMHMSKGETSMKRWLLILLGALAVVFAWLCARPGTTRSRDLRSRIDRAPQPAAKAKRSALHL